MTINTQSHYETTKNMTLPELHDWKLRNCLKLADLLEDLPATKFDMDFWVNPIGESTTVGEYEEPACGATYCALGWAAASRQFPGLKVMVRGSERHGIDEHPAIDGAPVNWAYVARLYFPEPVLSEVFYSVSGGKAHVIELLRKFGGQPS